MDAHDGVTQLGPALPRVVASHERDRVLRDDLLQEIFVAAFTFLPRLAGPAKVKSWVLRIAHNRWLADAQAHVSGAAAGLRGPEA